MYHPITDTIFHNLSSLECIVLDGPEPTIPILHTRSFLSSDRYQDEWDEYETKGRYVVNGSHSRVFPFKKRSEGLSYFH